MLPQPRGPRPVDFYTGTLSDPAAGQVADRIDRRMFHDAQQATGLLGGGLIEVGVHAGNTPIESAQKVIVVVEATLGIDVQLGTVEDRQSWICRPQGAQSLGLLAHPAAAEPVDSEVFCMIGYRHILEATAGGCVDHCRQRAATIAGPVWMNVGITADIADIDMHGQSAAFGLADLT
jgi:hypothetical protein